MSAVASRAPAWLGSHSHEGGAAGVSVSPAVPPISILDSCRDPLLFAPWFRDPETWRGWFAFLAALFALPQDRDALAIYRTATGRESPPTEPAREGWLVVGRRGGKSFMLALVAVFLATFRDWRPHLAPGERATVMVIAVDRRQARVAMRYVTALLRGVPMLAALVEREAADAVDLSNQVTIEVHTASFRSCRGYTIVAALCDELAFWRSDDSANPDKEILDALRPGMATVPGAMLLCASSPYARRGELYRTWREHFGKPGTVLVWKADTRCMNPTVPERVVREAYEADPASAAAEYGAEFRADIETFIAREVIEGCIVPGRHELPPVEGVAYTAFVDPSGGSADSMTLAIAHREDDVAVLDLVRERRAPFSPESVVGEFAETLKAYRLSRVAGDRYSAEWCAEQFRKQGIEYVPADKAKSDIYREMLPMINSGKVVLLDVPRLLAQLVGLERRTARGGKDSIDHAPSAHDDLANAAAGAVVNVGTRPAFAFSGSGTHELDIAAGARASGAWFPSDTFNPESQRGSERGIAFAASGLTRSLVKPRPARPAHCKIGKFS